MNNKKDYKGLEIMSNMQNRSFYLYKMKYPQEVTLPDFLTKFANTDTKIKENILDINISEEEKRKHLLVIVNQQNGYLYGLFYRLKQDIQINIIDEEQGTISIQELEAQQKVAEKSRLIIDLRNNLIFGEYNDGGVRFFQQPFGEYIRTALGRKDLDIEVVYDKESYENIGNKDIRYFKIKVTKPKLKIMEDIFNLSGTEVFDEADNSESLTLEIMVKAGRKRIFNRSFVEKILNKFNNLTDTKGIKKFEIGQRNFDIPLELVKACILRRKIDIEDKEDNNIFEEIVRVYEELNLNELLDLEEDD